MSKRIELDPRLSSVQPQNSAAIRGSQEKTDFAASLQQAQNLRISRHAQQRIDLRQIQLGDQDLNRLNNALEKAAGKGCRDSLVLMDNLAFVVNVRNRTIVTAMDVERNPDAIFTQIDSVVLADKE
jgi:flagellar operon protein